MAQSKSKQAKAEQEDVREVTQNQEPANNGQQLIPAVENTALAHYQDRVIVNELYDRIMRFHPSATDIGQQGMMQVAQLALLMGASPLPATNEIHAWKDNKNKVHVQPGINYWRRRAQYYGGIFWRVRPRPMTPQERITYDIPANDIGAICVGMKANELAIWTARGIPWKDVVQSFAQIGLGSVTKAAGNAYQKEKKAGRPLSWTAIKRCETDILKQLFPYQPGEAFEPGAGLTRTAIDGEYTIKDGSAWASLDMGLGDDDPIPDDEDINELFGLGSDNAGGQIDAAKERLAQKAALQREQAEQATPDVIEGEVVGDDDETATIVHKGRGYPVPKSVVKQGEAEITSWIEATYSA
jgi:hypothetical protein